jgi:phage terminase small subunit
VTAYADPLEFLRAVWKGEIEANAGQIRAASAALPFLHQKLGEGGKKDEAAERAKAASGGKFKAGAAPKLVAAGGKKV